MLALTERFFKVEPHFDDQFTTVTAVAARKYLVAGHSCFASA